MRLAKSADLLVRIGADISDFRNKIRGLQSSLKGIGDSLQKAGQTMTKTFTAPIVAAGAAIAGITFKKGFDRLTAIDTAKAKLEALGHSGKNIELIMDSALTSVKGTAFGLGDAATAAASAVAAGIKPGKELTQYLTNIGDAAAIAGVEFNEMAYIFNKITTGGKATREELNMLADRGIPIFQWLQEELGVTGDEFQKMVSEGKIDAETFNRVIEKNIGGAAQVMGEKSFVAGIANIGAAIGRLGAAFLDAGGKGGGFFSVIKDHIPDVINFLDGLSGAAEAAGVRFGNFVMSVIDKIKQVKQWFDGLSPSTQALIGKIVLFGTTALAAIGPALIVVGKMSGTISTLIGTIDSLSKGLADMKGGFMAAKAGGAVASGAMAKLGGVIATLLGPVGLIIGAIVGLIALFVVLYQRNEEFRDLVHNVWNAIKEAISTVIQAVSDFVMEVWGGLVSWWSEHGEMIRQAAENVWNVISTVITTVMNVIWTIMQTIWPVVQAIIVSAWENIKGVIQGAINIITGIIQFFAALFTGDWSALWDSVKQIVTGAVQLVWNLVQLWFVGKILKLGKALFNGLRGIVTNIWNTVKSIFTSGVNTARNVVSSGFNFIRSIISSVMNTIRSIISSIWNGIRSTISSVVNGIKNTISRIFNSLRGIVSSAFGGVRSAVSNGMRSAFNTVKNFFGRFKDAGKNIVQSIADGIKGAVGKVTKAIGNVTQKIRDFLPFSPAKEGPLMDIHRLNFGGPIAESIADAIPLVQAKLNSMLTIPPVDIDSNTPSSNSVLRMLSDRNSLQKSEAYAKFDPLDKRPIYLVSPDGRVLAEFISDDIRKIHEREDRIQKSFRGG